MQLAAGGPAAALYEMTPDLRAQRIAPHWASLVAVDDADRAAERAAALGGRVVNAPFDVFGLGRLAILQDPTGAMLSLWQAEELAGVGRGADARQAPGRLCWHELATSDGAAAVRFYSELFGWEASSEDRGAMRYTTFAAGSVAVGGMLQLTGAWQKIPSHWLPYFAVPSCEAAAAAAQALGGGVLMPPTAAHGDGAMVAVLRDPQSAAFGVREEAE
jgi:predicted enzyme related to lactoylglutathione lyase